MIALDFCEVRPAEGKGMGLFAKRFIPKGTMVTGECEKYMVISPEDFSRLARDEQESLLHFCLTRKDGSVLVLTDEGRFMNHSCNANILETGFGFDIVVRDIMEGEELTADYRQFHDYLYSNKPLICACSNSLHNVTFSSKISASMRGIWNSRIIEALMLVDRVPQPLSKIVLGHKSAKQENRLVH